MAVALPLLLSVLAVVAAGRGLLGWLARGTPGPGRCEMVALSWLLGVIANAWLLHLSLLLSGRVLPWLWLALLPPAVATVAGLARRPLPRPRLPAIPQPAWIPAAVIATAVLSVAAAAPSSRLAWDGLFIWALKAKALHLDLTTAEPMFLRLVTAPGWEISHPEYPLALPAIEAWIYSWLGRVDEQAIKIVNPVFYLCLLALAWSALRRLLPAGRSLLLLAVLATVPGLVQQASVGYADLALATLLLAAAARLAAEHGARRVHGDPLALLLAAAMLLMKREGTILLLSLLGASLAALAAGRRWREAGSLAVRALMAVAAVAGPWIAFSLRHGLAGKDFETPSVPLLLDRLDRIPAVAVLLYGFLKSTFHFGWLWYAVPLVLVLRWRNLRRPEAALLGAFLLLALAAGVGIFVFSRVHPYPGHVTSALDRLVVQVVPAAVLLLGALLSEESAPRPAPRDGIVAAP